MATFFHLSEFDSTVKEETLMKEAILEMYSIKEAPLIKRKSRYLRDELDKLVEYFTSFSFPSGRTIVIGDYLDAPNGNSARVELTDRAKDGSQKQSLYECYYDAEKFVVSEFKKEMASLN